MIPEIEQGQNPRGSSHQITDGGGLPVMPAAALQWECYISLGSSSKKTNKVYREKPYLLLDYDTVKRMT